MLLSSVGLDETTNRQLFALAFFLCVGGILSAVPFIFYLVPDLEQWILVRMDLPAPGQLVTFPILTGFLSEQALACFIGTTLVTISRYYFESQDYFWSLIVSVALLGASLVLISLSTFRFSYFFRNEDRRISYLPALLIALVVTVFVFITEMLNRILIPSI